MFTGFPEETIRFFLDIRFHNESSFFKTHEDEYKQFVKKPFYEFVDAIAPTMQKIADDIELRPAKCLARLRRDTRFTKDKTPFRDHMWVLFRRAGEPRDSSVMYWFELSPEAVEWGLGFWGYNKPAMDILRSKMLKRPSEMLDVLRECRLPSPDILLYGDNYRRLKIPEELPQELEAFFPRKVIYLKRTSVSYKKIYSNELVEMVSADYFRLMPMYNLLRSVADEAIAKMDA